MHHRSSVNRVAVFTNSSQTPLENRQNLLVAGPKKYNRRARVQMSAAVGLITSGVIVGAIADELTLGPTLTLVAVSGLTLSAVLAAHLSPEGFLNRNRGRRWLALASVVVAITLPLGIALTRSADVVTQTLVVSAAAAGVVAILTVAGFGAPPAWAIVYATFCFVGVAMISGGLSAVSRPPVLLGLAATIVGLGVLVLATGLTTGGRAVLTIGYLVLTGGLIVGGVGLLLRELVLPGTATLVAAGALLILALTHHRAERRTSGAAMLLGGFAALATAVAWYQQFGLLVGVGALTIAVGVLACGVDLAFDLSLVGAFGFLAAGAGHLVSGVYLVTQIPLLAVGFFLAGAALLTWSVWLFMDIRGVRRHARRLARFLQERPEATGN